MFKIYGPPPGKGLGRWILPLWKSVENENVENSRQWKERDMEGNMVLRMKKVRPGAQLPQRQTAGSAGFDLCACIQEPVVLEPGDSALFPTGLAAEIPQGHVAVSYTHLTLPTKAEV